MFHLHVAVKTGAPLAEATARTPGATFVVWCNFRYDIIEIQAEDPEAAQKLEHEVRSAVTGPVSDLSSDAQPRRLGFPCPGGDRHSISAITASHAAILLHPVVYEEGRETYRMIAFDDARVPPLFDALKARGEVKVIAKRRATIQSLADLQVLSPHEILGSLTAKQADAILASARLGYYQVPRRSSLEVIARDQGVRRSAFQEHVRKAESKIISAVIPTLAMMRQKAPGP